MLVTLVIAIPVLLLAEGLNRRSVPAIDQGNYAWVRYGAAVLGAFFFGGAISGRRRRSISGAMIQGLLTGFGCSAVLIASDVIRRVLLDKPIISPIVALWIIGTFCATFAALIGGIAGGLCGRKLRRWARQSLR